MRTFNKEGKEIFFKGTYIVDGNFITIDKDSEEWEEDLEFVAKELYKTEKNEVLINFWILKTIRGLLGQ